MLGEDEMRTEVCLTLILLQCRHTAATIGCRGYPPPSDTQMYMYVCIYMNNHLHRAPQCTKERIRKRKRKKKTYTNTAQHHSPHTQQPHVRCHVYSNSTAMCMLYQLVYCVCVCVLCMCERETKTTKKSSKSTYPARQ